MGPPPFSILRAESRKDAQAAIAPAGSLTLLYSAIGRCASPCFAGLPNRNNCGQAWKLLSIHFPRSGRLPATPRQGAARAGAVTLLQPVERLHGPATRRSRLGLPMANPPQADARPGPGG